MQIVRHKFNGGLVGDSQRWQSDLEQYQFSLVQSSNMLPTPYGEIKRRPPLVSIGTLSSITVDSVVYYPIDARAFDFVYSSSLRYIAVFVVYSADGEDDITRIVVQDTAGTQKGVVSVPYTQLEVLELDIHHTNDVMYVAHHNHPPSTLVRNSDTDWTFTDYDISGGPFLDETDGSSGKLGTSATEWRATISYISNDLVLGEGSTQDDITWVGTVISAREDSVYSAEYDFSTIGEYYSSVYFSRGTFRTGYSDRLIYYPYLLARINNATVPSEAVAGATVYINVTFTEDGNDTEWSTTATIIEVIDAGSSYYVKINTGALYEVVYNLTNNNASITKTEFSGIPNVEIPAASVSEYNSDVMYAGILPNQTWAYSLLSDAARRAHFFVFGRSQDGGSEISDVQNISFANSDFHYRSTGYSANKKPSGDITDLSDAGGGEIVATSAGHTLAAGDQVTISGTTSYNGSFEVESVTTDTFNITDTYVSQESSGKFVNTTNWEEIAGAGFSGSNVVEVISYGAVKFAEEDEGRLIKLRYSDTYSETGTFSESAPVDDTQPGPGLSEEYVGLGQITIQTSGNWYGRIVAETRSEESSEWVEGAVYSSYGNGINEPLFFTNDSPRKVFRLRMDSFSSGYQDCDWVIEVSEGAFDSLKILEFIDESTVIARYINGVRAFNETLRYAMGAWGGANGYPGTVTVYENRLWLSGSIGEPFKHWGSVVNKYWNFAIGTFVTSAIIFQARADSSTRISWTEPKDNLFFGTDFGEYSAVNLDQSNALSASNPPKVERHTSEGSARIPAIVVGSAIAFVSADKQKLKLMRYDALEQDGYRSYDMCFLNPEIAGSGFVGMCLQRSPYPIIWLWTADGNAAAFMIDRENGVLGWSEHSTANGLIKSLCVVPDENGIDEVYTVTEREDLVAGVVGSGSPDVTSDYDRSYPVAVTVSGLSVFTDLNRVIGYIGIEDGYASFRVAKPSADEFRLHIYGLSEDNYEWRIEQVSGVSVIETIAVAFNNSLTDPPKTGWSLYAGTSETTAPTIAYDGAFVGADAPYYTIDLAAEQLQSGPSPLTGYRIYENVITTPLYESATLYGTYTPVSGSGATGTVEVSALNYHIEKLDYTEAEYTDNLNGPSEGIITSIFEPTPLSRGPNFLEGNMKFRSERGFVYVVKSNGGEVSVDGGNTWHDLDYSDLTADENGLYTGKVSFRANSGYVDYSTIQVRTTGTKELRVSAIRLDIKKHERGGR